MSVSEFWTSLAGDDIDANMGPGTDTAAHIDRIVQAIGPALASPNPYEAPLPLILDLGCGAGRVAIPLARTLINEAIVLGVDPAENLLDEAKRRDTDGLVSWLHNDGDGDLYSRPEEIDAAYSMLVFQHLPADTVRGYLAEIARVLKPGGRFMFQWTATDAPDAPDAYQHNPGEMMTWANAAGLYRLTNFGHDAAMGWWWATMEKP